ncbi:MAG TPA: carbohydrate ABC transporter permease [Mesotoga infera]|uniref:ABC-type sugar transport system, permease component n=1 Tax=Mesotoga infera TaxID=1236046 RepID=A0A7Z7LDF7_9BACT|nr:carbohydrate ABC transporter permease [Mesotoga infera]MBP8660401.1 carbohydrate ABC transporter permease [Mesotoga sp.]NLI07608.1 carbohydrate ABC transporter permease [Thermotogaceae bacterium]SSC11936.1 ABC-type sugar transport system, permease component [Mesotoga infera]HOI34490.1 carbohydrate ABC transporter permease [Mesotoga infera]HON28214.1 carbohydrate ABC transporter permease [Mesotoga infera]
MKRRGITVNIIALLIALVFIFPLYWTFLTAFRTEAQILEWPPKFLPVNLTFANFKEVLAHPQDTPVFQWFINSLFAAVSYASLSVVVGVMAAFALARMQFRFRDAYFKIILASMAVPGMILFLPNYTTIDTLGWTDNLVAIIVPGLASTFGIFLLRQFFISVPKEIEEAAIIDGANIRQRIFYVIAPLAKESIIILWVMNFMSNWNDYLWALVVLYSPNKRTMPVGMSTLQGKYVTQYGPLMAGALFIAVPSILIFLLVQRYYIKGIDISGAVKE